MESCVSPSDRGAESTDPPVVIVPVPKCTIWMHIPNSKQNPYTEIPIDGVRAIMVGRDTWGSLKLPSSSQDSKSEAIMHTKENCTDRPRDAKVVAAIISPFNPPAWPLWGSDGPRQVVLGLPSYTFCTRCCLFTCLALGAQLRMWQTRSF